MRRHNHVAIAVNVVLQQVIGFLFYSSSIGPLWTAAWKLDPANLNQANPAPFIFAIFQSVLLSYVMSWLVMRLPVQGGAKGGGLGAVVGVGIVAPAFFVHYSFAQVAFSAALIDALKEVVSCVTSGALLAGWRRR